MLGVCCKPTSLWVSQNLFFQVTRIFFCLSFSNQSENAEIVVGLTAGPTAPNWACLKSVNRAKSPSSGEAGLPLPSLQKELGEHLQAGHLAQMDEGR